MPRVKFFREFESDDSDFDIVAIDDVRLGQRGDLIETDYLDALGIEYKVIETDMEVR